MGQNVDEVALGLYNHFDFQYELFPDRHGTVFDLNNSLGNINVYIKINIDPWCEENLKGRFAIFAHLQHFEFEEDKVIFILRWA